MPDKRNYILQSFLPPLESFPAKLYLGDNRETIVNGDAIIKLNEGEVYEGGDYFNSFYSAYWQRYTGIKDLGIHITYQGKARISLCSIDLEHHKKTLAEWELIADGDAHFFLSATDFDSLANSRVYVRVEAISDFKVFDLNYVTSTAPVRDVKLSIGLCTYKREIELAETLSALLRIKQTCPAIAKVTIVNHDKPFSNEKLLENTSALNASVISQGNLGGCGGFNRTMYEATIADDGSTHHLLMDDDIELDPRIIPRAVTFLSHTRKEIALGGHMFDSMRQTILHEAGAKMEPLWYVEPIANQEDMADPHAIDIFNQVLSADYNAWWFCILPISAIKKIGFSPPIFIHGDDIEYGCRLAEHDYETVSPPGVAVWHESFTTKNSDWIYYYDLRNRLILSVMHPERCKQPDALYHFGWAMHYLLMHRYRAAAMLVAALEGFLSGPEELFKLDSGEIHEKVVLTGSSVDNVKSWGQSDAPPYAPAKIGKLNFTLPQIAWNQVKSFAAILILPKSKKRKRYYYNNTVNPSLLLNDPYLLVNDVNSTSFLEYGPNKISLISGTYMAFKISIRYHFQRKKINKLWMKELPKFYTTEAWKKVFKKS